MTRSPRIERGDVFWVDPNPVAGREMRDRHPFVVITPAAINALGLVMTVPLTSGSAFAKARGLTVAIRGKRISGVAVCNQIRTFDLTARVQAGSARFAERIDARAADEIVARVLSVIDPAT